MDIRLLLPMVVFSLWPALPDAAGEPARGGFVEQRQAGDLVYYTGSATLGGMVEKRTDEQTIELIGNRICFYPRGESEKAIPRGETDLRLAWFCFSNYEEAMRMLRFHGPSPDGGCGLTANATATITDYVVDLRESSVFDQARLLNVVASDSPRNIPCPP